MRNTIVNSIQDILSYIIRCYVTVDGNIVTVNIIKAPIIHTISSPLSVGVQWGTIGKKVL